VWISDWRRAAPAGEDGSHIPAVCRSSLSDGIRKCVLSDRSQFFKDLPCPSTALTGRGAKVRRAYAILSWLQGMMDGMPAKLFLQSRSFRKPTTEGPQKDRQATLILTGDAPDACDPATRRSSSKLGEGRDVKGLQGAPQACAQLKDEVTRPHLPVLKG